MLLDVQINFLLFRLLLLKGSCLVFYPTYLSFCDVDVQLSHQRFGGLKVSGFPFFITIFAA